MKSQVQQQSNKRDIHLTSVQQMSATSKSVVVFALMSCKQQTTNLSSVVLRKIHLDCPNRLKQVLCFCQNIKKSTKAEPEGNKANNQSRRTFF